MPDTVTMLIKVASVPLLNMVAMFTKVTSVFVPDMVTMFNTITGDPVLNVVIIFTKVTGILCQIRLPCLPRLPVSLFQI